MKRQTLPGLLLGMTDAGSLERRVLRLLDRRVPWAGQRRRVAVIVCLSAMCLGAFGTAMLSVRTSAAQKDTGAPKWQFDVVSIRPHPRTDRISMTGFETRPDGVNGSYMTLAMLLQATYGWFHIDNDSQMVGLPDWGRTDRFDMHAKLKEADMPEWQKMDPKAQSQRRQEMLQQVMAERFHLKLHTERKVMPVFALVTTKGGFKIPEGGAPTANAFKDKDGKPLQMSMIRYLKDRLAIQGYSLTSFAEFLSASHMGLGRPVVDKTGLAGKYNFELEWAPAGNLLSGPDGEGSPEKTTDLMTALENIGLKLEATKEPVDVIVIDQVERPTEN